ncbi:hypothetical protein Cgig2_006905 [Carnegiea gigantea]|uniref:Uncharacterized protein n=1 Tax=Carnegiea gigantea TaxID=171969 RepID=A0A9Q1K4F2_9CARY|nr:hypothetical protein Cgig2_006905 [Carnegiea gigantea]
MEQPFHSDTFYPPSFRPNSERQSEKPRQLGRSGPEWPSFESLAGSGGLGVIGSDNDGIIVSPRRIGRAEEYLDDIPPINVSVFSCFYTEAESAPKGNKSLISSDNFLNLVKYSKEKQSGRYREGETPPDDGRYGAEWRAERSRAGRRNSKSDWPAGGSDGTLAT